MRVQISHWSLVKYRFGGLAPVYIYTYHHHKHTPHFAREDAQRTNSEQANNSKPITNLTFAKKGEPASNLVES